MEIPNEIIKKARKSTNATDIYKSECSMNTEEAFKIIHNQQKIIEDIQGFCLKSLGDTVIDKSYIKRILKILGAKESSCSPMGTSKNLQKKTRIYRKDRSWKQVNYGTMKKKRLKKHLYV